MPQDNCSPAVLQMTLAGATRTEMLLSLSDESEKFKTTLQFEEAGPVEVEFVVQKAKPVSKAEDHGGHQP